MYLKLCQRAYFNYQGKNINFTCITITRNNAKPRKYVIKKI